MVEDLTQTSSGFEEVVDIDTVRALRVPQRLKWLEEATQFRGSLRLKKPNCLTLEDSANAVGWIFTVDIAILVFVLVFERNCAFVTVKRALKELWGLYSLLVVYVLSALLGWLCPKVNRYDMI